MRVNQGKWERPWYDLPPLLQRSVRNGVASGRPRSVQGRKASCLWRHAFAPEEKRQGARGRHSNPRRARCADLCNLRLRQAAPPIDSAEQRKAQRDEAERINQLIRRRLPADEQPVDESDVDAGDATDAAPTRSRAKGPSGGSRVKESEIGFGEEEARLLPEISQHDPPIAPPHPIPSPSPGPNRDPHPSSCLPQPGALARDCRVAARAWR